MRGSDKPTGVQVSYGVRGFVKLRDARKGWLWESRVSEALDLGTRESGASSTSGIGVSTQMWYSSLKVVFGATVLWRCSEQQQ